ncbi:MAG: hypothetical protein WBE68_23835 [Candidatus Nitrosopolaris sp.]
MTKRLKSRSSIKMRTIIMHNMSIIALSVRRGKRKVYGCPPGRTKKIIEKGTEEQKNVIGT